MYILLCNDGSYYTGSTVDLERRIAQHEAGEGANHTRKHGPVKLVYYEWYPRIDHAFYREKQVQGWNRQKKEALISGEFNKLPELAKAYRDLKGGLRGPQASDTGAEGALASSTSANANARASDDRPTGAMPEALEGEAPDSKDNSNAAPEALEGPRSSTTEL